MVVAQFAPCSPNVAVTDHKRSNGRLGCLGQDHSAVKHTGKAVHWRWGYLRLAHHCEEGDVLYSSTIVSYSNAHNRTAKTLL